MEAELKEFDKKCTKPLPPILVAWRKRWVRAIEKEKNHISVCDVPPGSEPTMDCWTLSPGSTC